MRFHGAITAGLLLANCVVLPGQTKSTAPDDIVIGRHTFIDVGPPNDYYEVIHLRASDGHVQAERVLLTPQAGCFQPAKAEFSQATLKTSMDGLIAGVDPCRITDKQIKKELRRRTKFPVFSGENVFLQLNCNGNPRVLPSAVLDRDLFDPNPQTPEVTSWTLRLPGKVDHGLGPGVWDKPMFSLAENEKLAQSAHPLTPFEVDVKDGKYDRLFQGSTDRVSEIYADSLKPSARPTALLLNSSAEPDSYVAPLYPPIAKLASVEGDVSFRSTVGESCRLQNVEITGGPGMLRQTTVDALKQWHFCELPKNSEIRGTIRFQLNCHATLKTSVSQR